MAGGITAMSKRILWNAVWCVAVLAVLIMGIRTAYAHCGKCLTDAKYFSGALDKSKLTLAAASTVAEVETKGTAVHATVLRTDQGVNVEVHLLVGDHIEAVVVDGQTGKVSKKGPVKDLETHAT
jgi:hypothetical protein